MQSEVEPAREHGGPAGDEDSGPAARAPLATTVGLWAALLAVCAATAVVCKMAFAAPARAVNRSSSAIPAPGGAVRTEMDQALPASIAHLPLTDQDGRATDLAAFHGKILMIPDTMTLCQETCPPDTADLVQTAREVDAAGLRAKAGFLTATIDPARDTSAQLSAYRALYQPVPADWAALTGSAQTIATLWKYFEVYIQKVPEGSPPSVNWRTDQPLTYDPDHSDEIFFIDGTETERFLFEGMGHIAPGTSVPSAMKHYLDDQGLANLAAPASDGWTVPQALQTLSWLTQHPTAQASGS